MAYKVNIDAFLRKSPEEQAKEIEKQTKELLKRLPTLKKQLKMYGDVSSEMYNLTSDEVSLMGSSYASAVRGGEITAPSSKQAYSRARRFEAPPPHAPHPEHCPVQDTLPASTGCVRL